MLLCEQIQKGTVIPKQNAGPILLAARYLKQELPKEVPHGDAADLAGAISAIVQALEIVCQLKADEIG